MAKRGSKKALADQHETYIARLYGGERVVNSGQTDKNKGDVKTPDHLVECKMTGEPGKEARSSLITRMEKIADQAWEESLEPMLALRFFMPESVLASGEGYVDVTLKLSDADAYGSQTRSL